MSTVAEASLYFTGFMTDNPSGIARRVAGEPPSKSAAVASSDDHRGSLAELALDGDDAGRK